MHKICILVVLLAAAIFGLLESELEEKPGYCRNGDTYIKEGERGPGPIGKCIRVKCANATPGHIQMSGVGCSTFVPRPGCTTSAYDKTKRYPDCCPKEVCPDKIEDNQLE